MRHEWRPVEGLSFEENTMLSHDQKQAFTLIMDVDLCDDPKKQVSRSMALRITSLSPLDKVRKAIMYFNQSIERRNGKSTLAFLKECIEEGREPEPPHATENRKKWKRIKKKFPDSSYDEIPQGIVFKFYPFNEVPFSYSKEIFKEQVCCALIDLVRCAVTDLKEEDDENS